MRLNEQYEHDIITFIVVPSKKRNIVLQHITKYIHIYFTNF